MITVFDIETASGYASLNDAPEDYQLAWHAHCERTYAKEKDMNLDYQFRRPVMEQLYKDKAALHPEFGRIVCISFVSSDDKDNIRSFVAGTAVDGEKEMILAFNNYLRTLGPTDRLVGQYIKAFDIPYLVVRGLHYGLTPASILKMFGVKPWESRVICTKEVWKLGQYQTSQSSSLQSICMALGLPSPKDEISGKDVSRLYWEDQEGNIPNIVKYCEKDVDRTAKIYSFYVKHGMV